MPLPQPTAERTRIQVRSVQLDGYKRVDGRWDIEARLTDIKDHDYTLASGTRKQGVPLHDMWVRVCIDWHMNVLDAVACTDAMPYVGYCDRIAPDYSKLIGLNLFDGFRQAVKEKFEGVQGCSHITELLMFLPTAALQTLASEVHDSNGGEDSEKPYQLDRCYALDSHSEAVQRYYPRWYRGPKSTG